MPTNPASEAEEPVELAEQPLEFVVETTANQPSTTSNLWWSTPSFVYSGFTGDLNMALMNDPNKAKKMMNETPKVRKPALPPTGLPSDSAQLTMLLKEAQAQNAHLQSQIVAKDRDLDLLFQENRDLHNRFRNCPSLESIYESIMLYVKTHKLPFKPRKDVNIVSNFIGALEYAQKEVPDDVLVD